MPALNFEAQFAPAVERLEKRQTIRARGKRKPPKVGDTLFLYTGMRTARCRKLGEAACLSCEAISISVKSRTVQIPREVGGQHAWLSLFDNQIEALSKADGFESADAFFAWFGKTHGDTFSGYLIKW